MTKDIVMPNLKRTFVTGFIYNFSSAMTTAGAVMFLISARHKLAVYTLFDAINSGEYGVASLISSMIIVITIAVTGGVSALVLREKPKKRKKRRRGMYLEMKDLSKSFDGKEVVSGLNLSMNQGEILCLLGASGCGKPRRSGWQGDFLNRIGAIFIWTGRILQSFLLRDVPYPPYFSPTPCFPI